MKKIKVCAKCGSGNIDYLGQDKCFCHKCNKETETKDKYKETPYERNRRLVYATGNKWAIENWNELNN